jgi:hypothetical protein
MHAQKLSVSLAALVSLACAIPIACFAQSENGKNQSRGNRQLEISRDARSGKVLVSWTGHGSLKTGKELNGRFTAVGKRLGNTTVYETVPAEEQALFRVEAAAGSVISVNIVGYVNLSLGPGLSLIANPLVFTNNSLSFWMPTAPNGAQVFKYTDGGFAVSTFDGETATWSNPDLQVPIGDGFYFSNPSGQTVVYTFVGEVMQGLLINPLPAGISTKGSLVPQAGSVNSVHLLPGESGDEIRLYESDGQGGGIETISVFDAAQQAWVPDVVLGVGRGFWIRKQNPQAWARYFAVN